MSGPVGWTSTVEQFPTASTNSAGPSRLAMMTSWNMTRRSRSALGPLTWSSTTATPPATVSVKSPSRTARPSPATPTTFTPPASGPTAAPSGSRIGRTIRSTPTPSAARACQARISTPWEPPGTGTPTASGLTGRPCTWLTGSTQRSMPTAWPPRPMIRARIFPSTLTTPGPWTSGPTARPCTWPTRRTTRYTATPWRGSADQAGI